MSNQNRVRQVLGCNFSGLVLVCSLLGMETGKVPGIRVFKVTDGVPFTMGKVDSRRILYPEMGARKLTLNYAVSQPGHEFPQHVHDYSDDTFLENPQRDSVSCEFRQDGRPFGTSFESFTVSSS